MAYYVTIIDGKVCYGATPTILQSYINAAFAGTYLAGALTVHVHGSGTIVKHTTGAGWTPIPVVKMSDDQFIRFKSAGRRDAEKAVKANANAVMLGRVARAVGEIEKWDVARYGVLRQIHGGPWGPGAKTNRDHLLAHAENLEAWKKLPGSAYAAKSEAELKDMAYAVAISGKLHREASITYGGRSQSSVGTLKAKHGIKIGTTPAEDANRMRDMVASGGSHKAARIEMESLLSHKASRPTASGGTKSTLRIEMVGAYVYLGKQLIKQTVMVKDREQDLMMLHYLDLAVQNDDGAWRINPAVVGRAPVTTTTTTSGTKYT